MKPRYTRLTRSPVNLGTYKRLWLADDHIMQVESTGYGENYQRFRFEDIQAIFIAASERRLWWNVIWGIWIIVPALKFIGALINGQPPVGSSIFLLIGLIFLGWNNLLGPSCRVFLVTKVQTVRIGAISRRRTLHRVLARIQPLITAVQGTLDVSELEAAAKNVRPPQVPPAISETQVPPVSSL